MSRDNGFVMAMYFRDPTLYFRKRFEETGEIRFFELIEKMAEGALAYQKEPLNALSAHAWANVLESLPAQPGFEDLMKTRQRKGRNP